MLKRICIVLGLLLLTLPAPAAGTGYFSVIEDLPLMPGMTEESAEALVFDKPAGRIVETSAEILAPAAEIEKFYAGALPPLGWKAQPDSIFIRDDEMLKINIEQGEGAAHVHFTLTPHNEGK